MNIDHALDRLTTSNGFAKIMTKYMMLVNPGDKFIILPNTDMDSVSYITNIKKLGRFQDWVLHLKRVSTPFETVDSILLNFDIVSKLKELATTENYIIESYIPSEKLLKFSQMIGIPLSESSYSALNSGACVDLNDKFIFKKLSEKLGIKTIEYSLASNKNELVDAIGKIGSKYSKIIIKKTFSTGGYGNLSGSKDELLRLIDDWYNPTELVLVEPFVDIIETLGSLTYVSSDTCKSFGVDAQLIRNGGWKGCSYPYNNKEVSSKIQKLEAKYSEHMLTNGLQGYLNIDWAIVREQNGRHNLYAIESNYRYNGFSFVLDVAKDIFDLDYNNAVIFYDSCYEFNLMINSKVVFLEAIERINYAFNIFNKGGVVCTSLPHNSKVELMLVAENEYSMKILKDLTRAILVMNLSVTSVAC